MTPTKLTWQESFFMDETAFARLREALASARDAAHEIQSHLPEGD